MASCSSPLAAVLIRLTTDRRATSVSGAKTILTPYVGVAYCHDHNPTLLLTGGSPCLPHAAPPKPRPRSQFRNARPRETRCPAGPARHPASWRRAWGLPCFPRPCSASPDPSPRRCWRPAGPPGAAVTARLTGAALILAVPAIPALRGRWHQLRDNWLTVLLFGFIGVAACQLFYFNAVARLSVGVALLLEYLAPVLIVLWLWAASRKRPRPADHRRNPPVPGRAGPGPGPHGSREDRPHRRAVGDRGRRLPGHLLLHHGQGKRHPPADRPGLRRADGGCRRHVAGRRDRACCRWPSAPPTPAWVPGSPRGGWRWAAWWSWPPCWPTSPALWRRGRSAPRWRPSSR